jgi:predicted DNA-binding transcriptional regulator
MANTTKVTKRDVITMMLNDEAINANEVYVGYLKHELELLDKKSTSRKPTKSQEENEGIKAMILGTLVEFVGEEKYKDGMRISEMQAEYSELAKYSNQKISALLRQLIVDRQVAKTKVGKDTRFKAI